MVSGDRAWEIARWLREHASELGVMEVIHAQKIWTTQRSSEGWRSMSDRGSATANHYDHVHISVGRLTPTRGTRGPTRRGVSSPAPRALTALGCVYSQRLNAHR